MKKYVCRSDYNSKLFNGLELVMLVDILVFRFFLRSSALETVGWLGFFFLQVRLLTLACKHHKNRPSSRRFSNRV